MTVRSILTISIRRYITIDDKIICSAQIIDKADFHTLIYPAYNELASNNTRVLFLNRKSCK